MLLSIAINNFFSYGGKKMSDFIEKSAHVGMEPALRKLCQSN